MAKLNESTGVAVDWMGRRWYQQEFGFVELGTATSPAPSRGEPDLGDLGYAVQSLRVANGLAPERRPVAAASRAAKFPQAPARPDLAKAVPDSVQRGGEHGAFTAPVTPGLRGPTTGAARFGAWFESVCFLLRWFVTCLAGVPPLRLSHETRERNNR